MNFHTLANRVKEVDLVQCHHKYIPFCTLSDFLLSVNIGNHTSLEGIARNKFDQNLDKKNLMKIIADLRHVLSNWNID